jgi:hypothetical protein
MGALDGLRSRRETIMKELAGLEQIRRGSVTEQYFERRGQDGTRHKYGPYALYTSKKQGKTHSQRIPDPQLVKAYRSQTQGFHRFQELTAELVSIGEQISDLVLSEQGVKKTSKRKSKSKKTPR